MFQNLLLLYVIITLFQFDFLKGLSDTRADFQTIPFVEITVHHNLYTVSKEIFFHAFQALCKFGYFFNSWLSLQEPLHILLVRVSGLVNMTSSNVISKTASDVRQVSNRKKILLCFSYNTYIQPKTLHIFFTSTCIWTTYCSPFLKNGNLLPSKRTCPVKQILLNFIYEGFFCNCFYH